MPKALSAYKRDRIITYLNKGRSSAEAADQFDVSVKSVSRLWKQYQLEKLGKHEYPKAKVPGCKPGQHPARKIDKDALLADFNAFKGDSLAQRAKRFNVSSAAIHQAKKRFKLEYRRKTLTWVSNM